MKPGSPTNKSSDTSLKKDSSSSSLKKGLSAHKNSSGSTSAGTLQPDTSKSSGDSLADARFLQSMFSEARFLQNIATEYTIGEAVMPSTHRGQEVRFAKRIHDGRKYVIKIRDKQVSFKDPVDIATWRESMGILLYLQHQDAFCPHIGELHELIEDNRNFYVVMQLVDGIDLFEFLHSSKPLDLEMMALLFRKVAYEILCALADYKRHALVHKDLKLENVVLTDNYEPYIFQPAPNAAERYHVAFNMTQKEEGGKSSSQTTNNKHGGDTFGVGLDGKPAWRYKKDLTPKRGGILKIVDFDTVEVYTEGHISYDVMGTDQYISPESYYGLYSASSDMFAVGSLLYKTVTGTFPFLEELFDDKSGENYVGHPKMRGIRAKLRVAKMDFVTHPFFQYDKYARNFIQNCLTFDYNKRLTVEQALAHPAMQDYEKVRNIKWMELWQRK